MDWLFITQFAQDYPNEVADIIESQQITETVTLLRVLPEEITDEILPFFSANLIARLVKAGESGVIQEHFVQLPFEKMIAVLSLLTKENQDRIISRLDDKTKHKVMHYIRYGGSVVGSVIEPCTSVLQQTATMAEALDVVEELSESNPYIYVLNDQFELCGLIDLFKLLKHRNDKTMLVQNMMKEIKYRISANTPITSIYQHRAWREVSELPVVNSANQLIGIITYQKIRKIVYPKYQNVHKRELTDNYAAISELIWASIMDITGKK